MELGKKLREVGWHLTEEGLKIVTTAVGSEDVRKIVNDALNRDLRDIGGGALPAKRDDATLPGKIVLQVQRVRNIAAPKANEESKAAPRLLQLDLSDGQNSIKALELEPVPQLNLNVAPGSKIYFKAEKLQLLQGFLLLKSSEIQLLGGRVDALYEKWDLARTMMRYARSGRPLNGTSAPPPWVAFGRKIDSNAESEMNFKSLGSSGDKDKTPKENEEFNAMRTEAIAVASKAGGKKIFGGGGQNIIDHNVKKILDKGFSEEEALSALSATRNNLERALYNLKRRNEAGGVGAIESVGRPGRGDRPPREGKRGASAKDEVEAAKPAANTTLFDFLTNKLPAKETPAASNAETFAAAPTAPPTTNHFNPFKQYGNSRFSESDSKSSAMGGGGKFADRSRFENNVSSSFAAHRGGHVGSSRGGGRNRGGGRDERPPREERSYREDRPPREEKPPKEERPPRERGAFNDRPAGRYKPDTATVKTANRNGSDNAPVKPNSEIKPDHETTNGKDHTGNRRGSDRGSNRGGSNRAENGNANGNRRNKPAASSISASSVAKSTSSAGDDFNARLSKITEETANLKVSSAPKRENRRKQGGQGQGQANRLAGSGTETPQQQQPAQLLSQKPEKAQTNQKHQNQHHNPRHNSHANYSQLPNGYTYDPSKIMGFQSKEANEFAMSLLKSQGVTLPNQKQQQQQQQLQESPPTSFGPVSAPVSRAQPAPVAVPQTAPRDQFGMVPGDAWMWQKGDLCMAKYWDDGRYYEAEITGVSEKTCVVFFMGYGNHEEVLKVDILPITDAQNRPLSNSAQQQQAHLQQQQPHLHQQQHSRYRGDRQTQQQQVYVPPHKREH
ncbi:tudor domain-containing protein 3 [Drosophila mauritiana]|uniref:Survival of motor neuron-related-splicing factor 30 n=1 Tax=Drosophila mauritiana TaxID=7226 RepID=A0A6P8JQ40_DROMA|nr:tudor domain-containing protein 3 [Drosophila mauritiana]